jgi:hypothetical protein
MVTCNGCLKNKDVCNYNKGLRYICDSCFYNLPYEKRKQLKENGNYY